MALETKEKVIEGLTFSVTQLPARRSIKLKLKLASKILPVLGPMANIKDLDSDFDSKSISSAIEKLMGVLDYDVFMDLAYEIYSYTRVGGKEVNSETFDIVFNGNLLAFYKGIAFVLEVEYKSFLGEKGIGKFLKTLKKPTM